jgi:hypothetical protein
MKKTDSDDLRSEYRREDLGRGVRGKYYNAYQEGTNLVLISPEAAKVFPTEEAVNNALLSLIDLAKRSTAPHRRRPKKKSG